MSATSRTFIVKAVLATLLVLQTSALAFADASFVVFDPPGSTSTIVTGINASGTIAGWSFQGGLPLKAFIRQSDGTILDFQVPGENGGFLSTYANAINTGGAVAGYYQDEQGVSHGFIRQPDGSIAKIDGAAGDLSCLAINDVGDVAGRYFSKPSIQAGFLRTADGKFKKILLPHAQYTDAVALNSAPDVIGTSLRKGAAFGQGYLRSPIGIIGIGPGYISKTFHPSLYPAAINQNGFIAGEFNSADKAHGFLRYPDRTLVLFDPTDSVATGSTALNDENVVAGNYLSGDSRTHGFIRDTDGTLHTFDPPGSVNTQVNGINNTGVVTGSFLDGTTQHGYLRTP